MKKVLRRHPFANAYVVITDNGIALVSYSTTVAFIDNDGYLTVFGLYSMTTRKHIGYFLREYADSLNYYDAKQAYMNNYKIHTHNGDIIELM